MTRGSAPDIYRPVVISQSNLPNATTNKTYFCAVVTSTLAEEAHENDGFVERIAALGVEFSVGCAISHLGSRGNASIRSHHVRLGVSDIGVRRRSNSRIGISDRSCDTRDHSGTHSVAPKMPEDEGVEESGPCPLGNS